MSHVFKHLVTRAGIVEASLHDLRRTCATYLQLAGVSAAVTQKFIGHASITTTLKYYTSISDEVLKGLVAKLPYVSADAESMGHIVGHAG